MRYQLVIAYVFLFFVKANSQVENNNIGNRTQLFLDSTAIPSTTRNSTVEWDCINKKLTGKCLVYHNDQWFYFSVPKNGTYFLVLSSQSCKYNRGLQLILIEGNPCEVASYSLRECISKLPQDDIYIRMDSLQQDVQYLINIDGFRGDICEFSVGLTNQALGLPHDLVPVDTLETQIQIVGQSKINLNWKADEDYINNLEEFIVYRRDNPEPKSTLLNTVPIALNAYGTRKREYALTDTLSKNGTYSYYILGRESLGGAKLLSVLRVIKSENTITLIRDHTANVRMLFKKNTPVGVYVYDSSQQLMSRYFFHRVLERNEVLQVDVADLIKKGYREFVIKTVSEKTGESKSFRFEMDNAGEIVAK